MDLDNIDIAQLLELQKFQQERAAKEAEHEKLQKDPKTIGSVYFHISNSGITFRVIDEGWGPTVVVGGSAFGNMQSEIKLHIDNRGLIALSKLFAHAAKQEYTDEYCHKGSAKIELNGEDK